MKRILLLWLAVCCAACLFGGCGRDTDGAPAETTVERETQTARADAAAAPGTTAPEDLSDRCNALTVCIFTDSGNNGAGFLFREQYVVTNAHVLDGAADFTLTDCGGAARKGTVVFSDAETDVAIVRTQAFPGRSVTFGEPDAVAVGERLLMIGNPADGEPFSRCMGARLDPEDPFLRQLDPPERYLITDAPITSGYSGGPAFNQQGELVGICNAAYLGDLSDYAYDHVSLVIPIDRVREMIETNCP